MKKKFLSLFVLLSFLVLQVLSPIVGKEAAVSAADGDQGVANLDYTFESVDGTSVSTKSNPGQATVLVFGSTTCGNTQRTVKSIAASGWFGRSDIRVIFAEIDGAAQAAVQTFAATYGCNNITFCYDEGYDINRAMWEYYHLFSDSVDVTLPVIVLIDGNNRVRDCLTAYQKADAIMAQMQEFVAAEPTATPSQEPAQKENPPKNSTIRDSSGNTYEVTSVSAKAFHAKAKIKVPKKQLKTYEKRLKVKGQKKTVKITS